MLEEKLYHQMEKIRPLVYEIESLANILETLINVGLMEITNNDLIMLVHILNRKIIFLSKMYERQALVIEQIQPG